MRNLILILIFSLTVVPVSFSENMGEIKSGETKKGEIVTAGREDTWTFSASAGDGIILKVIRISGIAEQNVRVLSPDLNVVSEMTNTIAVLDFVVETTGTYTVLIRDDNIAQTGDYNIEIYLDPNSNHIYVDGAATGANNGTSWANAYIYLQDAIDEASISQTAQLIKVAQGLYTPDTTKANPGGTGERNATFRLLNNVILEGGYVGVAGADPDSRDVVAYETILSGDLNGDDVVGVDPNNIATEPTRAENSYHVVTAMGTNVSAVLDGFTITGGNADNTATDSVADKGGGMLIYDGSPTVNNCTYISNSTYSQDSSGGRGGGVYIANGSPTLTNCTFISNVTDGIYGGGLYNHSGSPILTDCLFVGNIAGGSGGGIHSNGNPLLKNCTFENNSAGETGGGMSNRFGDPNLIDCTFTGNSAGISGGGFDTWNSEPILLNCIFTGNRANSGGGISNETSVILISNCTLSGNCAFDIGGGIYNQAKAELILTNSILWDNFDASGLGGSAQVRNQSGSIVTATYSCIKNIEVGIYPGTGNINSDPNFALPGYWSDPVDPNVVMDCLNPGAVWVVGDYHLCSIAGRWDQIQQAWVVDQFISQCIDAGDPNSLWEDEPMSNGGRINMGAYGGTNQASKSPAIYALTYIVGANGSISGDTNQTVKQGEDGTAVTPVPNTEYHFVNWSDGSTDDPRKDTNVTADITVTAVFDINNYQVDVNSTSGGSTDKDGSNTIEHGDSLTITPSPDDGYHFTGWSGDASGGAKSLTITVTSDMSITASFEINKYTLTYNAGANGSIDGPSPQKDVEYGADGDEVTAVANDGFHFVNWSDESMENPRKDKNVMSDITVTAVFSINDYQVNINSTPGGSTDKDGTNTIQHGDTLIITATPDVGYRFIGWSGDATGDANIVTVSVTSDMTITANFEKVPPVIVKVKDVIDSSDGQPETYFLPPGITDDSIPTAEGGKYYRNYTQDWGWTHTFGPSAPKEIIEAKLTIEAFDVDVDNVHEIYGDGELLGKLEKCDGRWRTMTFELDSNALDKLMDGTMKMTLDIQQTSYLDRITLRSSTLEVEYIAKADN